MTIWDLETPALLVDLDRLEANLKRVGDYCARHRLRLRPHTKTHKTPDIARLQLAGGAAGLTVAKVGEAEVMAAAGAPEILVAYPVLGDSKWRRLMGVAKSTELTVALDNLDSARGLARHASFNGAAIGILVEADVGMGRCGLAPGGGLVNLASEIAKMPGLRFDGLMFYPGHVNLADPQGDEDFEKVGRDLERIYDDFRRAGIPLAVVSGGSTPTLFHSHRLPGLAEIRPGTYVFNDCSQVAMGACGWEDCAAAIMTTVVSTPREGAAIVDGGSKTFTSDPARPDTANLHGRVMEDPAIRFYKMSEEHGFLDVRKAGKEIRIGDRLRIVPNHICTAVNMHERIHGVRGETVENSWRVEGRGKLQ